MSPRETEGTLNSSALSGLAGRLFIPPVAAFLLVSVYVVVEAIGFRGFARPGEYDLRPLEAAVLARHAELVRLLLRDGAAHFDTSRASCFARARLPEVLPDLGAPVADSAQPTAIAAAFRMCGGD
jgi:hypothetical protein